MAVKKKYNFGGREIMGQEIAFEAERNLGIPIYSKTALL